MPLAANGYAKLIEELGELQQVLGKRLAYYTTEDHPDGGPPIKERLEEEIADVLAAIDIVLAINGLDANFIAQRRANKCGLFAQWHAEPNNNRDAVPL